MADTPRKRRRYSEAEKQAALTALILAGGNSEKVGKELGISPNTLRDWRSTDSDLYERLRNDLAPVIAEKIAADAEALAVTLTEVEQKIAQHVLDHLEDLKPGEAASALRNVSTSKALQFDKLSSPVRGRPTVIHAAQDAGQALVEMGRRLGIAIDSTAVEIPQNPTELEAPKN